MTKSADLPPPPDDYFLEIESHFASRRGTPFIFSAKDWGLIREWKEAGVPLAIVIEAIDQCFEKRKESARRSPISSLSYCRHAVKDLWSERKELQVGAEGEVPETSPESAIAALVQTIRDRAAEIETKPIRERIELAADEIEALRMSSVPTLENAMIAIEESLYTDLNELLTPALRSELEQKLDRSLEGVEFRDEATRSRTREANLRRILRAEIGLPRLSLFG